MFSLVEFLQFLYNQKVASLPAPNQSLAGKTVIVTGSNTGLGKYAALNLARLGATTVILAVRNIDKGEAAKHEIEETVSIPANVVQVWQLDLCSFASVQEFAARAMKELTRVDILLENAGLSTRIFREAEGNEMSITVNVLSTFLLALLLIPKLKETAQRFNARPTLTIVTSDVHSWTTLPERSAPEGQLFEALSDKTKAAMGERYPVSKLLEIFAVRELASQYPSESYPVTINAVNPGLCHSELTREVDSIAVYIFKFLLARSTDYGSRTLVHAGLAGSETHGQYLSDCKVTPPSKFVRSGEGLRLQKRVWMELSMKLEEIRPGLLNRL